MVLVLIAVAISFLAAFAFRGGSSGAKTKRQKRQIGWQREEMEIEPSNVPVFKPSWKHLR